MRTVAMYVAVLLGVASTAGAATLRSGPYQRRGSLRGGPASGKHGLPLSLAQLLAEPTEELQKPQAVVVHQPLYSVQLNFDFKDLDPSKGMSMVAAKNSEGMRLDLGQAPEEALAWGHFDDNIDSTGWSELYMHVATHSEDVSNTVKMYAAGYAEGIMTCVRISEYYANTFRMLAKNPDAMTVIKDVIENQMAFMRSKSDLTPNVMGEEPSDPYWKHVRFLTAQLWGLTDGYNAAARHFGVNQLGLVDMALINMGGELPQIIEAYTGHTTPSFLQMQQTTSSERAALNSSEEEDPLDDRHWERRVANSGRCTAMVRVTTGNFDILVGHTTWDDYSKMTRVFKYYNFHLHAADTMANHIAFSSYPGAVSSTDDYYVMDSGLTVTDTSIEILDRAAWSRMPQFPASPYIPAFAHVMAVNRLARDGPHWAELFTSTSHPGTYAAQWMIVDYKLFTPGEALKDNTLWIVEVLPGTSQLHDETSKLRSQGFWGSYNRPFFPSIREVSGHFAAQRSHGDLYSYDKCPRAGIMRSNAGDVNSLFDMRALMARNNYAMSGMGPGHDMSARMDLDLHTPFPNGGIDAKVVNRCGVKLLQVQAQSGPTHESLGPFRWSTADGHDAWPQWPHIGQPDVWLFEFQQMSPAPIGSSSVLAEVTDC
eukprot:TRINITY_DN26055_c0_g1_i1.p1 TRINITY_DN26055_c0_g1~~TRINITY_DN26055_c0_g1_i1.p1  ORF type:complete len:652 (-),score=94.09 TRINITY_DN26055_c0_g1_i1:169-2124(-)